MRNSFSFSNKKLSDDKNSKVHKRNNYHFQVYDLVNDEMIFFPEAIIIIINEKEENSEKQKFTNNVIGRNKKQKVTHLLYGDHRF